jgi:hypothetical protein
MSSLMTYIITSYSFVKRFVIEKQSGLCRCCSRKFAENDLVIEKQGSRKTYYHKECAERLNIL